MPGWLTNSMGAATSLTGNETIAADTNLTQGQTPQTEAITLAQLATVKGAYNLGNITGNVTLNWMNGAFQYGTATGNFTLVNPVTANPGGTIKVRVTQDATGSRLATYGNAFIFSGHSVLSTAANSVDVYSFEWDSAASKVNSTLAKAFA